ncbi:MAG TPA: hypothetical protein VE863_10555, partial [Pyrinomonadaceae bacterium]|nr:hypothetical protein [Pyrinomonadaceae bacterium]
NLKTGSITKLSLKGCTSDYIFATGGCEPFVFSLDGKIVVKERKPFRLLDSASGSVIGELTAAALPIVFSPTEERVLVTRSDNERTILIWEVNRQ